MILYAVLGAFAAFLLYMDVLYPFVIYPLRARWHKCGYIPRDLSWPLGIPLTLVVLSKLRKDMLLQFMAAQDLSRPYKTSLRQFLGKWVIATRDPENIKAVLSTKFNDFSLKERGNRMRHVIGDGIFTQDGAPWKHSRDMLRPQFTKDQISRVELLSHHIDVLIREIRKSGGNVELQRLFHLMTMDTATHFLFGESVGSLEVSGESKGIEITDPKTGEIVNTVDFVESYTFANKFALKKIILNDLEFLADLTEPSYKWHLRRVHTVMDHYVQLALKATEKYDPDDDSEKGEYYFSHELAKLTRDPLSLRDQLFNILIAGRDTTAATLSYAFHYLTKNPAIYAKVREDVLTVFPNGDASLATYEDLRKAKYLQMVIKEVLRLAPAVPLNTRAAVRDTYLPRGGGPAGNLPVFVPKGTAVNYPTYILHRDPDIYGADAYEFNPERWRPENKLPNSPMYSWGYIPFNGGPRICIGQQFALTEIALTMIKLVLEFERLEPADDFEPNLQDKSSLTVMVGGSGVRVKLS
uniref:Cytochrome P450 52-N1 n=2 Tax=Trichomonascaceae TaxID=410830 RepID=CP52N_STABO|nr:RecName: Full=Cytochrome P450 52-N1; Short=CYP52-N1; AltName: Full=Cytochrome P450 monooxygenase CYP52-N1 [Starmerella bombicola]ACD75402.1 cytochrome P450 monooxygenase CYP52-N1 [Starmerella bombicola]AIY55342.1 cytochrome P450 monooxygenase CYP52-N1 [Wickerhamiella domercqiae]